MPGHCSRSTFVAIPACLHLAVLPEGGGGVRPVQNPAFRRIACRHPYHLPASHCPGYLLACRLPLKSFACHLIAVRHDVRILRPDLQHHEMTIQTYTKASSASLYRCRGSAARCMPVCTWRSIKGEPYIADAIRLGRDFMNDHYAF